MGYFIPEKFQKFEEISGEFKEKNCLVIKYSKVHFLSNVSLIFFARRPSTRFKRVTSVRWILSLKNGQNFWVNSDIFKDDESEAEAKTNSGHRVCPLLVRSPLLACAEHTQSPLFIRGDQKVLQI